MSRNKIKLKNIICSILRGIPTRGFEETFFTEVLKMAELLAGKTYTLIYFVNTSASIECLEKEMDIFLIT